MISTTKSAILVLTLAISPTALSQNAVETRPEKKTDVSLEGMIGISYGSETLGINVGGPSLKLKINQFRIGVGAFPSLIVSDKKAFPKLAVSPIIEYKNVMLIAPYYGYDAKDKMLWTFGLGYKFY
jgi:hypothetical protein